MLCQDCWQAFNPDQYAPEGDDWGECEDCGNYALLYDRNRDSFDELDVVGSDPDITDLPEWADSAEEFFA